VFKALVLDLIVREDLRGAGIGQLLMTSIKEHELLRQVKHFELYCVTEMQNYYEQLGYKSDLDGIVLMRRS
jgi:predicted N-acetyltransferase YhbS